MLLCRDNPKYMEGVNVFLNFTKANIKREKIICPCMKCANRNYENRTVVQTHLILHGIRPDYNFWYFHGEKRCTNEADDEEYLNDDDDIDANDDINEIEENVVLEQPNQVCEDQYMEDLINDLYPNYETSNHEDPVDDAKTFYKLLDDSKKPLYEGAKISKASTLLKLLHIKSVGQWTNTSFDMLLRLLKEEILPGNSQLPNSYYECKKFISDIGLTYQKIDACTNNCMLFRKDDNDLQECKVCVVETVCLNGGVGHIAEAISHT